MTNATVSDGAHGFVQACQAALTGFTECDRAAQATALWDVLNDFPRVTAREADLTTAAVAISRLAMGFFRATTVPAAQSVPPRSPRGHVNAVLLIVRDEYRRSELSLGEIAKRLKLSQSYLSRVIHKEARHAFPTQLNCIRILAAVEHLRLGVHRKRQLAAEVGYISTGELDRQFHKRFGVSPRSFENLLRKARPECLQW